MGHSIVGPSGIGAIIKCPGKVRMEKDLSDVTSFVAAEGSVAHEIGEARLKKKEYHRIGKKVKYEGHNIIVDQAMIEAVNVYVDHVNDLRNVIKNNAQETFFHEIIEDKVSLEWMGQPLVWGTCDYALAVPFVGLWVRDYKHGQGVIVSPENNAQMMCYALAAAGEYLDTYPVIDIGVVQPRGRAGDAIKTWRTTPNVLKEWAEDVLIPAIISATGENAPLNPGEEQCRFCRAKGHCPALAEEALKTAQADFSDFAEINPDTPEELSPERLVHVYGKIKLLNQFIKGVEARVFNDLATGKEVPGYKLVTGRKSRSWKDESEAITYLYEIIGENAFEKKPLTPAKAEKILDKEERKKLKELIAVSDGKPAIVPESDKREPVSLAKEDFKEFAA